MISRKSNTLLLLVCLLLFCPNILFPQSKSVKEYPSDCEHVRHILDQTLAQTSNLENVSTIIIFRLGRNETSRKVIDRRMKLVKNHIKFRNQKIGRFLLAEAEKTNGLGKLEIYIAGKLTGELFAKKNANFGYDCLEEPF